MLKKSLIPVALLCFGSMAFAGTLNTGPYESQREDIRETDTEIRFTLEIIYLSFPEHSCRYRRQRFIETKEGIFRYLRHAEQGEYWTYEGTFSLEGDILILNLTLVGSTNPAMTKGSRLKLELLHSDYELRDPQRGKVYRWIKK